MRTARRRRTIGLEMLGGRLFAAAVRTRGVTVVVVGLQQRARRWMEAVGMNMMMTALTATTQIILTSTESKSRVQGVDAWCVVSENGVESMH
mmetsp:Transcript_53313/g.159643  ORF Transcript_53313/g.159643 Transcript_53313/m.159643 type:complete len:92 (-) Transcript_53313:219-494(-)